ncbi:MAG: hypothetical protein E7633_03830 [Ruminococcaceae bacterium]|nr:hypothetical protein [Oscillospiraceae bacterium]
MKKHIANIITGSRIIFSLPLLLLPLSSVWFYALYLLCGFTDMIDVSQRRARTQLARRNNCKQLAFQYINCIFAILWGTKWDLKLLQAEKICGFGMTDKLRTVTKISRRRTRQRRNIATSRTTAGKNGRFRSATAIRE